MGNQPAPLPQGPAEGQVLEESSVVMGQSKGRDEGTQQVPRGPPRKPGPGPLGIHHDAHPLDSRVQLWSCPAV